MSCPCILLRYWILKRKASRMKATTTVITTCRGLKRRKVKVHLRDWSLITGRGGGCYKMGKSWVQTFCASKSLFPVIDCITIFYRLILGSTQTKTLLKFPNVTLTCYLNNVKSVPQYPTLPISNIPDEGS